MQGKLLIGQSGGTTAVNNAILSSLVETSFLYPGVITGVLGCRHGIEGLLKEDLVDLSAEDRNTIAQLAHTSSSALGSCRKRDFQIDDFYRVIDIFKDYGIRFFVYIGGNGSMRTPCRIHQASQEMSYDVLSLGIPKTVDNDVLHTDHTPGYGSAARFAAIAMMDTDLESRAVSNVNNVRLLEVPGFRSGWLAAATALGKESSEDAPHIILFPEIPLVADTFLGKVRSTFQKLSRCIVAVGEGITFPDGMPVQDKCGLANSGFVGGGGASITLARMIREELNLSVRYDKPRTLFRFHFATSSRDTEEALGLGKKAVEEIIAGTTNMMLSIQRQPDNRFDFGLVPLEDAAGTQRHLPKEFIDLSGYGVTRKFINYALPLIGEPLPKNVHLKLKPARRI